jgi:hypothetical protein
MKIYPLALVAFALKDWQVTIDFERHMLYFEKP